MVCRQLASAPCVWAKLAPLHARRIELVELLRDALAAVAEALRLLENGLRLTGDLGQRAGGDVGLQVLQHLRLVGQLGLQALDLRQALGDLLLGLEDRLDVDHRHLRLGGRRRDAGQSKDDADGEDGETVTHGGTSLCWDLS